jgi:hypothetical protein
MTWVKESKAKGLSPWTPPGPERAFVRRGASPRTRDNPRNQVQGLGPWWGPGRRPGFLA